MLHLGSKGRGTTVAGPNGAGENADKRQSNRHDDARSAIQMWMEAERLGKQTRRPEDGFGDAAYFWFLCARTLATDPVTSKLASGMFSTLPL